MKLSIPSPKPLFFAFIRASVGSTAIEKINRAKWAKQKPYKGEPCKYCGNYHK